MVKWTQKHFEQENQKEKLVKKAEEIVNTTGCKAFVDTVPTWQREKHWSYKSNENIPTQDLSATGENILQPSTPHSTPQKRKPKSRKEEIDQEFCQICPVRYESLADIETDSPWLGLLDKKPLFLPEIYACCKTSWMGSSESM